MSTRFFPLVLAFAILNTAGVRAETGAALSMLAADQSEQTSGNARQLLESCKTAIAYMSEERHAEVSGLYDLGYCLGFIQASAGLLAYLNTTQICIPDGASMGQLARVVVKYLEEHPEILHEGATHHTVLAWTRAFPCTQPRPKDRGTK